MRIRRTTPPPRRLMFLAHMTTSPFLRALLPQPHTQMEGDASRAVIRPLCHAVGAAGRIPSGTQLFEEWLSLHKFFLSDLLL